MRICDTMSSKIQSSNLYLEPVGDMGYSLELKTSPREQSTTVVKEKILSPRANQSLKFQNKRKVEIPFSQPFHDRRHKLRQNANEGLKVQLKSAGNHQKQHFWSKANKEDELVKHMSNLPGYLQRMERGENLQEKALNFGVLDWERLEKWKSVEKHNPERGNTKASSSSSSSSFVANVSSTLSRTAQSKTLAPQRKLPPPHGSHMNLSYEGRLSQGTQKSRGKVIQLQDLGTSPRSTLDGQQNLRWKSKSSGRNYSQIKRLDRDKRKESDQKTTSEKETSSSDLRKHGLSLSSHDTISDWDGETKTRVEDEFNLAHQHTPGKHQSVVLLVPKHSPKKSCSESFQLSESRIIFDRKLTEANGKRFSDCFAPEELHSGEIYSDIPHSCPLPVSVATNAESDMKQQSLSNAQGMELQSDAFLMSPYSNEIPNISSEGKCLEENKSDMEPSTTIETSKRLDEDIAEQPIAKGRHLSPNRRFSFSLSRMTRSFSVKEGSAVPQLSPTYAMVKSGPVRSEASAGLDSFYRDKANASSRARSSPLRRLLDPLLKPKGAHSAENVLPSKGNFNSVSLKPMNTSDLIQIKKHEASTVQAFLQLAIKNGRPLFKLAVDKSNDVLAAAVEKLPTSVKDDSSLIYRFYSVREIKKKSGSWINQGSRGKSCGFGYKIVAQMKVSGSYLPDLIEQNSRDPYVVRESVLYGVDLGQADKDTSEFVPNRELAAIVIMNPSGKNDDKEQSNKDEYQTRKGFTECLMKYTCDTGENENVKSTVVILPGGIHGMPNEGVPSPLINRWRSGGSCDCGGWDVGCKLKILTNQDQSGNISRSSLSCSARDRFDLFVQGGDRQNKPIFSLVPLKNGLYSVEFNTSISLLQAFSMCVVVISSQKSSDILEVNNLLETKLFPDPITGSNRMKTPTAVQGEVPKKFVSSPPPSPVGRV